MMHAKKYDRIDKMLCSRRLAPASADLAEQIIDRAKAYRGLTQRCFAIKRLRYFAPIQKEEKP
jgi:hypothetical protein